MSLSLFLAKLMGIFFFIILSILLLRKKQFETSMKEMTASELAISGVFILVAGLAIAIGHPVWEWSWRLVITLIGYFAIFQGIMRLAFPMQIHKAVANILSKWHWVLTAVIAVVAIFLILNGFIRSY